MTEEGRNLEDYIETAMEQGILLPDSHLKLNDYKSGFFSSGINKNEKSLATNYIKDNKVSLDGIFANLPTKYKVSTDRVATSIYNTIDYIIKNNSQSKLKEEEIAGAAIVAALVAYSYFNQTQSEGEVSLKDRANHILEDKDKIVKSVAGYFGKKDKNYENNLFEALKKVKLGDDPSNLNEYPIQLILFGPN